MNRAEKGQRVRDRDGHVGRIVFFYPSTDDQTAYVRWHKGFATTEQVSDLEAADE